MCRRRGGAEKLCWVKLCEGEGGRTSVLPRQLRSVGGVGTGLRLGLVEAEVNGDAVPDLAKE